MDGDDGRLAARCVDRMERQPHAVGVLTKDLWGLGVVGPSSRQEVHIQRAQYFAWGVYTRW